MLGRGSIHANECLKEGFIGADFDIDQDLTGKLPNEWKEFNRTFIPIFLSKNPTKNRIAAGLACGALWTVSKGITQGDIVLCPDGSGTYRVGEVGGDYYYEAGKNLPHRRRITWLPVSVERSAMSDGLKNSSGSIGTVSNVSSYAEEIERLIGGVPVPKLISTDSTVEDPSSFALEEHLEDFLVKNWERTELGKDFDIYEEDGQKAQQYQTDTGPLDILAISKDKKRLLVVELKKGRASDAVVGQTLRYMSYVQDELVEGDQTVLGIIIALDDDHRLRRALSLVPNIGFYRYEVNFKLHKAMLPETVDQLISYCQENRRVCPQPSFWNDFWMMLPNRRESSESEGGWEPPAPLILGAWWDAHDNTKRSRLEQHIRWAHQHNGLELASAFLRGLKESEWHHLGE